MRVLVLEASTSAAKAMVYDSVEGIKSIEVIAYDKSVGNYAEQDTEAIYRTILRAGRAAAQNEEITAVALSGTWHSVVVCDAHMNPITPSYTWAYTGASQYTKRLRENAQYTKRAYQATGCMVHAMYPAYKLAYFKENGLQLNNTCIAGQGSYLFYKLTGERLSSYAMKSGSGFLNIHSLEYEDEMLALSGIKKEQLPILCAHSDTQPLQKEAAAALGISCGIPVVPAMADGALNQVGSGALRQGYMTLSVGTSGALRLPADKPILPDSQSTWCYYTAGKHLCGAATSGATNCVDWFTKELLGGRLSYAQLEALISDQQNAPIFLPFLYGERCPGWRDEIKGGFVDVTGLTSIGDQYYAVLEGVLFNLYQCYQELVSIAGPPKKILTSGGICNSERWLCMLADIFQRDIVLSDNEQASLLGGAVLALAAVGAIEDIVQFSVPVKRTISPNPLKKQLYELRFARYQEFYSKLF